MVFPVGDRATHHHRVALRSVTMVTTDGCELRVIAALADRYNPQTENYLVGRTPTLLVELQPKTFGQWDIVTTDLTLPGPPLIVADRWGYPNFHSALDGATAWLADGCAGEPPGWYRHHSGRKRVYGDPEREYMDGDVPPG